MYEVSFSLRTTVRRQVAPRIVRKTVHASLHYNRRIVQPLGGPRGEEPRNWNAHEDDHTIDPQRPPQVTKRAFVTLPRSYTVVKDHGEMNNTRHQYVMPAFILAGNTERVCAKPCSLFVAGSRDSWQHMFEGALVYVPHYVRIGLMSIKRMVHRTNRYSAVPITFTSTCSASGNHRHMSKPHNMWTKSWRYFLWYFLERRHVLQTWKESRLPQPPIARRLEVSITIVCSPSQRPASLPKIGPVVRYL